MNAPSETVREGGPAMSPKKKDPPARAERGYERVPTLFKLRTDLKKKLARAAKKAGRTMSAELEAILEEALA